jgi:hypothetical protein
VKLTRNPDRSKLCRRPESSTSVLRWPLSSVVLNFEEPAEEQLGAKRRRFPDCDAHVVPAKQNRPHSATIRNSITSDKRLKLDKFQPSKSERNRACHYSSTRRQDDFPNVRRRLHTAMSIGCLRQRKRTVDNGLEAPATGETVQPMLTETPDHCVLFSLCA